MKDNLDQECVKRGFISLEGRIGTISFDFPGKMTVFPVWSLLFHLSLLKIWLSHSQKIIFFQLAIIGLFLQKFNNFIFKIVNLVAI